jgi:hypothetical protein
MIKVRKEIRLELSRQEQGQVVLLNLFYTSLATIIESCCHLSSTILWRYLQHWRKEFSKN